MNDIHSKGDLNLFRVLLAVADTGSTIEAGVQLNLSQSAVSHALRRLRDMLGDPLFVKNGRQLVMTAHTRSILSTVRGALEDLSSATLRSTPFDPSRSAMTFQCGLRDALEYLIMPALMQRARQQQWQVTFHSQRVSGEDIEARILSGALDMAVSLEYPNASAAWSIRTWWVSGSINAGWRCTASIITPLPRWWPTPIYC